MSCGAANAGGLDTAQRRSAACSRCAPADPGRPALGRGCGQVDRKQPTFDMDYTAVGQTTHIAARMEQLARPGSVLMDGRDAQARGRLRAGEAGRAGARQGAPDVHQRVRADRHRHAAIPAGGGRRTRSHPLRRPQCGARAASARSGPGRRGPRPGRRGGGRGRRRKNATLLRVHAPVLDRGLARSRGERDIVRQEHPIPARHRSPAHVLQHRRPRRGEPHPREGDGQGRSRSTRNSNRCCPRS